MQTDKNPERFSPFCPFFGLNNLLPLTGLKYFWPVGFSGTYREELYHPPGEQQTRGKSRFFIGDVLVALGSRAWIEIFGRFSEIFVLLARNFESTTTPRESLLDAYDCCLALPTPSHTPSRSVPEFRGLLLLVRSCGCPQVKWKHSVGGCFLSNFVYPKISTNFDHCSTSKSRCRPLLRTWGRPIWRESQALWMKHSW